VRQLGKPLAALSTAVASRTLTISKTFAVVSASTATRLVPVIRARLLSALSGSAASWTRQPGLSRAALSVSTASIARMIQKLFPVTALSFAKLSSGLGQKLNAVVQSIASFLARYFPSQFPAFMPRLVFAATLDPVVSFEARFDATIQFNAVFDSAIRFDARLG